MAEGKGCFSGELIAGGAGVGSMLALANPEGADLIITRFMIVKGVGAGGAFTVDAFQYPLIGSIGCNCHPDHRLRLLGRLSVSSDRIDRL